MNLWLIGLAIFILGGAIVTVANIELGDPRRDQFDPLFKKYSISSGVPAEIFKAIALIESDLGQDGRVKRGETSQDGKSWGLMQIAPRIGSPKEIELKGVNTTPEMLNDPETSVRLASILLGYLWQKYSGNEEKVVKAYNQGERHTDNNRAFANGYYQKYLRAKARVTKATA